MPSPVSPRRFATLCAAVFALSGCMSPERALEKTDAEAAEIVAEKQRAVFGDSRPFDVRQPTDRVRDAVVDPATGLATRPTPLAVDLRTAFEFAAKNSREFQDRKERLWDASLGLIRARERFRPSPFFNFGGDAVRNQGDESLAADGEFGVTKVLERGGSFALSAGGNFLRFITSPTSENAASFLNLAISLPLLRGAGEEVALEGLRQEERNVVYAVRDYERFKQTFAVRVESDYLRLLTSAAQVRNEEVNYEGVAEARRRNEALAAADRLTQLEVDQARQDELRAQNRIISRKNALASQLDAFKATLGLPIDLEVTVEMKDLDGLAAELDRRLDLAEAAVLARALRIRLDLQNARDQIADAERRIKVAENALLPDLTLGLGANATSDPDRKPLKMDFGDGRYSATFDADLGLDRDVERVALRQAHLDLAGARRAEEEFVDDVKRDVRDALRRLAEARASYDIQRMAVAVAERRRESVVEFRNRGDATTRDLLEAQEALVSAQNALSDALVEFRTSYLELFRDTGALVVRPEGLDYETSDALLLAP
jgi:outer membrane protein TolC